MNLNNNKWTSSIHNEIDYAHPREILMAMASLSLLHMHSGCCEQTLRYCECVILLVCGFIFTSAFIMKQLYSCNRSKPNRLQYANSAYIVGAGRHGRLNMVIVNYFNNLHFDCHVGFVYMLIQYAQWLHSTGLSTTKIRTNMSAWFNYYAVLYLRARSLMKQLYININSAWSGADDWI